MNELEAIALRRYMTEVMVILHRFTEVRKYGETKELHAYEDMLHVWNQLFPDPGDE